MHHPDEVLDMRSNSVDMQYLNACILLVQITENYVTPFAVTVGAVSVLLLLVRTSMEEPSTAKKFSPM